MNPVRIVWRSMSSEYRELAFAAFLGAVAAASAVALLGASGYLISRAAELPPVLTLTTAAVMVRMFALSRGVFRYVERLVGHDAAFRGLTQLRVRVYERLEQLAPVGLQRFGRGDLLNRLVADVDAAMDIPLRVILPWAQATLVVFATTAFLLWLMPTVAGVIALLALLALAASPAIVNALVRRAEQTLAPKRAALQDVVVNALTAQAELLAFGATATALESVQRRDTALTTIARRESISLGLAGGIGLVLQGAAVCLALWIAIPAVVDGTLAPVWLAVVAFLPLALFDVLNTIPMSAVSYQSIRGSASRVVELEVVPLPVQQPTQPHALSEPFRGLSCRQLSAGWADRRVLHEIDLDVPAGTKLVIVGPSGSGKSTLASVLMGFLDYQGSVRINGEELRKLDGDAVRRQITMLSQRAHIFDTSIADNVRIPQPHAGDLQVREALASAQLLDWVDELPEGISTEVGTFGAATSGGERQRIALARVLLANRPCVVLDEPTEHLDLHTAQDLDRTMLEALTDRTIIVITHRIRDIGDADHILVLEQGRVTAQGSRSAVMEESAWFAAQWNREENSAQMRERIAALPIGYGVSLHP